MKVCPKCKAEYRDGIDYCPDCDIELEEMLDYEDGEEMDPDSKPAYVSLSTTITILGIIAIVACIALTVVSIMNASINPIISIIICCLEIVGIYVVMLFIMALCEFFQDVHLIRLQGKRRD